MAKRHTIKAKRKKKTPKRSFFLWRVLCAVMIVLYRFCFWLGRIGVRASKKNPLLALGFFLFFLAFILVFYNASFLQSRVERPFLFQEDSSLDSRLRALIE